MIPREAQQGQIGSRAASCSNASASISTSLKQASTSAISTTSPVRSRTSARCSTRCPAAQRRNGRTSRHASSLSRKQLLATVGHSPRASNAGRRRRDGRRSKAPARRRYGAGTLVSSPAWQHGSMQLKQAPRLFAQTSAGVCTWPARPMPKYRGGCGRITHRRRPSAKHAARSGTSSSRAYFSAPPSIFRIRTDGAGKSCIESKAKWKRLPSAFPPAQLSATQSSCWRQTRYAPSKESKLTRNGCSSCTMRQSLRSTAYTSRSTRRFGRSRS